MKSESSNDKCSQGNRLKLKCVAMLGDFFLKTNEVIFHIFYLSIYLTNNKVSLERIGTFKGRDEGVEDMAPKAREKAKSLGSWWMRSRDQRISPPTLQPIWFSAPRTESYHGLGVRSSSSSSSSGGSRINDDREFTTKCFIILVCFFNTVVQL